MVTRICFLLIIIISGCSVFKKNHTKGNPPGTLKINDTLFIDQTEIANVHWREYWFYLTEFDLANADKSLPDTTVWINWEPDSTGVGVVLNNPFTEYYFRHPSFNNYPAVGISYEQAVEFCRWRTYVANQGVYFNENNIKNFRAHLRDTFPIKFYYRLPTKDEWEMIAAGKLAIQKFPYGYKDVYFNWKGKKRRSFNCIFPGEHHPFSYPDSLAIYTTDVKSFFPNSYGTYNMIGNLAEMVSEKGIAKGGSFIHPLDSCKISLDQHYGRPEAWLGFRSVAVKLK